MKDGLIVGVIGGRLNFPLPHFGHNMLFFINLYYAV